MIFSPSETSSSQWPCPRFLILTKFTEWDFFLHRHWVWKEAAQSECETGLEIRPRVTKKLLTPPWPFWTLGDTDKTLLIAKWRGKTELVEKWRGKAGLVEKVKRKDWTGRKREKVGQLCPSTETGWALVDSWCQLHPFNQAINECFIIVSGEKWQFEKINQEKNFKKMKYDSSSMLECHCVEFWFWEKKCKIVSEKLNLFFLSFCLSVEETAQSQRIGQQRIAGLSLPRSHSRRGGKIQGTATTWRSGCGDGDRRTSRWIKIWSGQSTRTKDMSSPGGATSNRLDRPETGAWRCHVCCPQLYIGPRYHVVHTWLGRTKARVTCEPLGIPVQYLFLTWYRDVLMALLPSWFYQTFLRHSIFRYRVNFSLFRSGPQFFSPQFSPPPPCVSAPYRYFILCAYRWQLLSFLF